MADEHPLDARLRRKRECTSPDRFLVVVADSWAADLVDQLYVFGDYASEAEAEAAAVSKRTRLTEGEACHVYPPSPDGLWRPGA